MVARTPQTLLTALGFTRPAARLYERLSLLDGQGLEEIAAGFEVTTAMLLERLEPLLAADVVVVDRGRVQVRPPAEVVSRMIQGTVSSVAAAHDRLREIAAAVPYLAGISSRSIDIVDYIEPLDGEIAAGPDGPELARTIIRQSAGDLLWLRPDQWTLPWEDDMSEAVAQAIASGRRCRAIYPARVLTEAPAVVRHRASIGEEIRLLPELPTRLIVVGASHLLLPEPLGLATSSRSVIRQRGLVELGTICFELLWAQGAPISDTPAAGPDELRRFLLAELARGAQDEQIARRLGMSLRTVRRRVADLMDELGAHSRFQAGVEAARRGWL